MPSNFTVPRFVSGPATLENLNAPLDYIQMALNQLSDQIGAVDNKSAMIRFEAPVSPDVSPGDLVYYVSAAQNCYQPALAQLSGVPGFQGQTIEGRRSRVEGLVLSRRETQNSAILLLGGYYDDPVIEATIGTGASPGIYYLSPDHPGKAVKDPGWNLRQPCISYYGDGKFNLFCHYLAHDSHHHAQLIVPSWSPRELYDGVEFIPEGGAFFYAIPHVWNFGDMSPETTAVFFNGKLDIENFILLPKIIWCKGDEAPADNSVVLFNAYPFMYGDAVVRSLRSDTLALTNYNGNVNIDLPGYETHTLPAASYAVTDIQQRELSVAPIISQLRQGPGMVIKNRGMGIYQIGLASYTKNPVMAGEFQLNGVQRVAQELLAYNVFPADCGSSMVMSLALSYEIPEGSTGRVKIWCTQKGQGTIQLQAVFYWIPSGSVVMDIPAFPLKVTSIPLNGAEANKLRYAESDWMTNLDLSPPGTLVAKLTAENPSKDIYIYQAGFRIDLETSEAPAPSSTEFEAPSPENPAPFPPSPSPQPVNQSQSSSTSESITDSGSPE